MLLESKRAWGRSLELDRLSGDAERRERAATELGAWTSSPASRTQWREVRPRAVFGVALVSSTAENSLDASELRNGNLTIAISRLIDKVGRFDQMAHPDQQNPYVLYYAVWRIRGAK